jgi:hypothetical protein
VDYSPCEGRNEWFAHKISFEGLASLEGGANSRPHKFMKSNFLFRQKQQFAFFLYDAFQINSFVLLSFQWIFLCRYFGYQ